MPTSIPLRHRLPNAPPLFVGRAAEAERLAAMIHRAPVTVVHGLGGIGKTSLALHALHVRFADRVARTVMVGLRPGDPPDQILVELMRALAAASGDDKVEWAYALSDREGLLATLLDAAEALDAWVLVDDLHHAPRDVVREVLAHVAKYGRRLRLIATSRVDPALPELVGQTLRLDAMPRGDLEELVTRADPRLDAASVARVVEAASGSPWQLRQILAGVDPSAPSFAASLLHGIDERSRALLEALAILELPLRGETLERAGLLPREADLDDLERRGLIERTPNGLRLHDVARGVLAPQLDVRALSQRVARDLGGDPAAALESMRLDLEAGRVDAAADTFDREADAIFVAGWAPRLWQLLRRTSHERLQRARLRCAVELGDPAILEALDAPRDPTPIERFLWALSLFLRGRLDDTVEVAADVRAFATAAIDFHPKASLLAFEAGMLEAACRGERGQASEALSIVEALPASTDEQRARKDVQRARWLIHLGRCDEALRLLDRAIAFRIDPQGPAAHEIRTELIVCYAYLGRRFAIEGALSTLGLRVPSTKADLFADRRSLLAQAIFDVFAGRLGDAERHLRALKPLMQQTSYLRAFHLLVDIERRMAAGELGGLAQEIAKLAAEARACGHSPNFQWSIYHAHRLAMLVGTPAVQPIEGPIPPTPFWEPVHAIVARRHALLHDLPLPERRPYSEACVHMRHQDELTRATERLVEGDGEGAQRAARAASVLTREHGLSVYELEADLMVLDALLVSGDDEELARVAASVEARAREMALPRFSGEARLAIAVVRGGVSPTVLEEIALARSTSPVAARRARALLGESVHLDRVDRVVVDAIQRRSNVKSMRAFVEAASRPGWGIDVDARTVWLPGDRKVDLSNKALLLRILLTIARHGGAATKEQLVLGAWELRDYHPIRDDKRLQVAIRKLRLLVEDDPARAARIVTTDDGYAFGKSEPFRVVGRP